MKIFIRKIFVFIVTAILVLNINLCTIKAYSKENFRVSAHNAIALDRETGQVLFEQKGYDLVPMASTTKILTALIAIQKGDLDKTFTVSKNAASVRGSKVGYKAGENITVRELLYGLMYKSGNDAAITIAEGIGGSIEGFAEIMNHFATSLGLLDSHFESPHGLDSGDHYSSAYDLAILTAKGMEYDTFREVVGTKEIDKAKYNFTRSYNNINKILWKIPGANGVKTGYTGQAGKCLVSSVNDNGKDIIIVVLNCPDRWNQTEKIYKYVKGINAYESMVMKELVKKEEEEYGFDKEEAQFEIRM
ncbi:D-alanyl-D-alanine carboxypeptidase [Clostridium sp. SHJSY1]|uniref:D-alanyl-D-alanine carboxypeptidase family protein n=1 Tax=Clostridium sp. SHJSY1 TaxID=2942483 RepID=UPI0028750826|nr:D-alanyl-D-alanine carboxypeptidase family protein [Clostridium sp. SHJSY1]MDS0527853.1 D-alanyl-D-alanine carboxypeptidase [Clostridium sp. SHJSY1]